MTARVKGFRSKRARRLTAMAAAALAGAALVTGVAAGGEPSDEPSDEASRAGLHECAEAIERCVGTVPVPLNWDDPDGQQIEAGFAFVPRSDMSRPAAGTVLVHPGGFAAYTGGVEHFQEVLGPVLEHQNLLVVDMRGTGTSSPLRCPGLDVREPATIEACADHLGPDAQYFTTDQAVADMNAVRSALGVDRLSFYGSSYGTVFGQAYATRFPGHTAAIVLDSADPMRPDGYGGVLNVDTFGRGLRDLDTVCERSRACRELPGSAQDRLNALVAQLRERPDDRVPLPALAQVVQKKGGTLLGREVNAAIAAYLDDDPAPLRRIAQPVLDGVLEPGIPINEEDTAALPFSCGDFAYPFDRDATPEERQAQLDAAYERGEPVRPFTVSEVFGFIGGSYPQWCVPWPLTRESPPVPPGADYPDVPALVIGGELDPGMGSDEAAEIAGRFPNGTAVAVPFGGHVASFGDPATYSGCVRDLVRSFLTNPQDPVGDPGCDAETYTALGTFPLTSHDVPPPTITEGHLEPSAARLLAATFATVEDALTRSLPEAGLLAAAPEQPGLRGGQITLDQQTTAVRLDQTRWVSDVTVTGEARLGNDNVATATVQANSADLHFTWPTRHPTDTTQLTGTLNGHPFEATLPVP